MTTLILNKKYSFIFEIITFLYKGNSNIISERISKDLNLCIQSFSTLKWRGESSLQLWLSSTFVLPIAFTRASVAVSLRKLPIGYVGVLELRLASADVRLLPVGVWFAWLARMAFSIKAGVSADCAHYFAIIHALVIGWSTIIRQGHVDTNAQNEGEQ